MIIENDITSAKLLIVDDDILLSEVISSQLEKEKLGAIYTSSNIADAEALIHTFEPDILLLDIELPDGSGTEFCQKLRQTGFEKPILMLTGKGDENDVIEGLDAGANDYITKPIRFGELLARINSQLRQFKSSDEARFTIGPMDFTPANKMLGLAGMPKKILLTEKETLILKMLFRAFPKPVTKDILLQDVWGFQSDLATHTLETHIYRLRQKIRTLTDLSFICTTENGYGLVGGNF